MNRENSRLFIPVLGIVLAGIQIAGLAASLSDGFRFILAILSFILWPGNIVARRFIRVKHAEPCMHFIIASVAGIAFMSVLTWVLMMLNANFSTYYHIMIISFIAIYIFDFIVALTGRYAGKGDIHIVAHLHSRRIDKILAGFALLIAIHILIFGVRVDISGDGFDHIGYVRKIGSENSITPHGVLADVVSQSNQDVKTDPRKGTLHPFLAMLSELTQLDSSLLWSYLPVFLGPLAFISFSMFSWLLLPGLNWMLACIMLFLMFQGGIGGVFLQSCASGQNLSLIFFWMISSLTICYLREEKNTDMKLIVLALLGGSLVHIGVLLLSAPVILSLFIFQRPLGLSRRKSFNLLLGAALVGLPVLLWKFAASYASANEIHMHPQALLFFSTSFFTVSPMEIIRRQGIVFLGGILLLPTLFFIKKNRRKAWLCGSFSFFPIVIAFNPLLAPFFYSRMSYMLHRLVLIIPSFQIVVLSLGSAIAFARGSRSMGNRLATAMLIILWVHLFLVPAIWALSGYTGGLFAEHDRLIIPEQFKAVVEATSGVISDGSIIASDPLTSYALSAYRDIKVVSVLHQHGNPNDIYAQDRLSAIGAILSPFVAQRKSLEELRRFGVEYIVLNGAFTKPVTDYAAYWNPSYIQELMNKYLSLGDNFHLIYDDSSVRIFRVLSYVVENERWFPTVPFLQGHEGVFENCNNATSKDIWVSKVRIDPNEVIPGEEIKITVEYKRSYGQVDMKPRKLVMRLENEAFVSRFGSFPGSKLVRRIAERRRGVLSRYTVAHNLMDGLFPPASWPIGSSVFEDFKLRIPASMLEGEYSVQLKIVRDSLLPNFHIRDLLYNNDSYSSKSCATLQVKKSLVR